MARLCLLVYVALSAGRFQTVGSESDVTPRLNFSYSKCSRLEAARRLELTLAYVRCVGVLCPARPHAVFRQRDVSCHRGPGLQPGLSVTPWREQMQLNLASLVKNSNNNNESTCSRLDVPTDRSHQSTS